MGVVKKIWKWIYSGEAILGIFERIPFWDRAVCFVYAFVVLGSGYLAKFPLWASVLISVLLTIVVLLCINLMMLRAAQVRTGKGSKQPAPLFDHRNREVSRNLARQDRSWHRVVWGVALAVVVVFVLALPKIDVWLSEPRPPVWVNVVMNFSEGSKEKVYLMMLVIMNDSDTVHKNLMIHLQTPHLEKVECDGPEGRLEVVGGGQKNQFFVDLEMKQVNPQELKSCRVFLQQGISVDELKKMQAEWDNRLFKSIYTIDGGKSMKVFFQPTILGKARSRSGLPPENKTN